MEKFKNQDHFETTSDFRSSSLSEPLSSCESPSSSDQSPAAFTKNGGPAVRLKKHKKKGGGFVYRIREHLKMGPKFSETIKAKLSVGAKIIKNGGRENIFKAIFGMTEGETLLKASQCYLSTTAGPIAGFLFISTEKVAFCSEQSITAHSSTGSVIRTPYKMEIPVKKLKEANESENVNNPAQKYIEIVTQDNFEFWFMGFVRYEKALTSLQKAISLC